MDKLMALAMPGGWEILIVLIVAVIPFLLLLFALIDAIKSDFTNETNKIVWILVILLFPFIGSILYFIMAGSQKR